MNFLREPEKDGRKLPRIIRAPSFVFRPWSTSDRLGCKMHAPLMGCTLSLTAHKTVINGARGRFPFKASPA